mgnify:CR=1 FL=1
MIKELREILSTVPKIKKDLQEIQLGTMIVYTSKKIPFIKNRILVNRKDIEYVIVEPVDGGLTPKRLHRSDIIEVTGNDITYRHLMMYAKEKDILTNWDFLFLLLSLDFDKELMEQDMTNILQFLKR